MTKPEGAVSSKEIEQALANGATCFYAVWPDFPHIYKFIKGEKEYLVKPSIKCGDIDYVTYSLDAPNVWEDVHNLRSQVQPFLNYFHAHAYVQKIKGGEK